MFQTNYTVNNEKKTITVDRNFNAPLSLVWQAWTDPAILDEWWAPKPWKTMTKDYDFRPDGSWLYAMVGPDGQKHWSKSEFLEISAMEYFTSKVYFCDESGKPIPEMKSSHWRVKFSTQKDITNVVTVLTFEDLATLEQIVTMGFKDGFAMAHQNLDAYLEAQFKLRAQMKTTKASRTSSYLNFPGNTEEAMKFYRSVFGTEFIGGGIQRFGDIPQGPDSPPVADNVKHMVLHAELPITGGHILMATDAPREMGMTVTMGNNMHICLEPETREEAKRLFDALSAGGKVGMPLADMFFGAYFGEFTDRYGINWMVNCIEKK